MAVVAEQMRTAMTSPEQLKRWLDGSGRRWLVFDALDLVDALEFPGEVEELQRLVTAYREHRQTMPSGRTEMQKNAATGEMEKVTIFKTDILESEEKLRAVIDLVGELMATEGVSKQGLRATILEMLTK